MLKAALVQSAFRRGISSVATLLALGGTTTSCSCAYANTIELPDDDTVRSIDLGGPDCNDREAKCDAHYDSGRCERFVAAAADGAHCILSLELASGVLKFAADYRSSGGCMSCMTSTLSDDEIESAIAQSSDK